MHPDALNLTESEVADLWKQSSWPAVDQDRALITIERLREKCADREKMLTVAAEREAEMTAEIARLRKRFDESLSVLRTTAQDLAKARAAERDNTAQAVQQAAKHARDVATERAAQVAKRELDRQYEQVGGAWVNNGDLIAAAIRKEPDDA